VRVAKGIGLAAGVEGYGGWREAVYEEVRGYMRLAAGGSGVGGRRGGGGGGRSSRAGSGEDERGHGVARGRGAHGLGVGSISWAVCCGRVFDGEIARAGRGSGEGGGGGGVGGAWAGVALGAGVRGSDAETCLGRGDFDGRQASGCRIGRSPGGLRSAGVSLKGRWGEGGRVRQRGGQGRVAMRGGGGAGVGGARVGATRGGVGVSARVELGGLCDRMSGALAVWEGKGSGGVWGEVRAADVGAESRWPAGGGWGGGGA